MKRAVIALAAFVSLAVIPPAGAQLPPISQLDVNAVPRLNADGIRRVQALLRQKGFESGKSTASRGRSPRRRWAHSRQNTE